MIKIDNFKETFIKKASSRYNFIIENKLPDFTIVKLDFNLIKYYKK